MEKRTRVLAELRKGAMMAIVGAAALYALFGLASMLLAPPVERQLPDGQTAADAALAELLPPGRSGDGAAAGRPSEEEGAAAGDPAASGHGSGAVEPERPDRGRTAGAEVPPDGSAQQVDQPASVKRIALTFDDGPDSKYTPQVLDILQQYDVKATFFIVGIQASKYPDVLRRIHDEGHEIGNHSWGHANFRELDDTKLEEQIDKADEAIEAATGEKPTLFRAPYGITPDKLTDLLDETDRTLVRWSIDTRDWAGTPEDEIVAAVLDEAEAGSVVLMHSFGGKNANLDNTIAALPEIIERLLEDGYVLTTVSGLGENG